MRRSARASPPATSLLIWRHVHGSHLRAPLVQSYREGLSDLKRRVPGTAGQARFTTRACRGGDATMHFKILLMFPLVLGIVPLVVAALGCWTEWFLQGRVPHERRARTRHLLARDASRGLGCTAYSAVALPEPLARRCDVPHFYGNYWETMAAASELVGDDIWVLWRCSDRDVRMRLRLRPQTGHGQLRSPGLPPMSLN